MIEYEIVGKKRPVVGSAYWKGCSKDTWLLWNIRIWSNSGVFVVIDWGTLWTSIFNR